MRSVFRFEPNIKLLQVILEFVPAFPRVPTADNKVTGKTVLVSRAGSSTDQGVIHRRSIPGCHQERLPEEATQ